MNRRLAPFPAILLGEESHAPRPAAESDKVESNERTVLFADLDGYTALTEAHGDLDAVDIAVRFAEVTRRLLRDDARIVKTLGDAVLIIASQADAAVDIATELVEAVDAIDRYPSVSAGLHTGPVIERDGDVFGSTVNIAARTAAHAAPCQVLCTSAVADRLTDERRTRLRDLGTARFANVPDPILIFEILGIISSDQPIDPVCRMQLVREDASAWLRHHGEWYFCSAHCLRAFLAGPERYVETRSS